jgi:hypothetical protein
MSAVSQFRRRALDGRLRTLSLSLPIQVKAPFNAVAAEA